MNLICIIRIISLMIFYFYFLNYMVIMSIYIFYKYVKILYKHYINMFYHYNDNVQLPSYKKIIGLNYFLVYENKQLNI